MWTDTYLDNLRNRALCKFDCGAQVCGTRPCRLFISTWIHTKDFVDLIHVIVQTFSVDTLFLLNRLIAFQTIKVLFDLISKNQRICSFLYIIFPFCVPYYFVCLKCLIVNGICSIFYTIVVFSLFYIVQVYKEMLRLFCKDDVVVYLWKHYRKKQIYAVFNTMKAD